MSDAAFRAWVALDRWAWRGAFPTNGQLAAACGWLTKGGRPSALKAKRAVRELEGLGIARRRTACVGGTYRREGIDVRRPAEWDHGQGGGSDLTRGWVNPDPGGGSDPTGGGGSNLTPSEDRCRQEVENTLKIAREPDNPDPERQRPETGQAAPEDGPEPWVPPGMPDRPGPPEDPAVLPTAIAAISRVARGMVTAPETEDGRLREQAESRRRQLDALAELIARKATRAGEAGRAPGPTDPTPEPWPAPLAEPPTPGAGLTDGQARWLETLGPEARAGFDALSPEMRSRLLAPHRDGLNVDPILEREAARVLAPRPAEAPPPPMPGTTAGLLENLPGAPPHWAQAAAEALARDFGRPKDRKLWPALLHVTLAVWQGRFPADAVLDAYRQGMGRKSKNRGAVFNTALRANGWVWEPGA